MATPEAVKLAAAKGLPDPNELIRSSERLTGSHIPERACRTRWQIEEERRQVRYFRGRLPRSNAGTPGN